MLNHLAIFPAYRPSFSNFYCTACSRLDLLIHSIETYSLSMNGCRHSLSCSGTLPTHSFIPVSSYHHEELAASPQPYKITKFPYVNQHRAWFVLGWVTSFWWLSHLGTRDVRVDHFRYPTHTWFAYLYPTRTENFYPTRTRVPCGYHY